MFLFYVAVRDGFINRCNKCACRVLTCWKQFVGMMRHERSAMLSMVAIPVRKTLTNWRHIVKVSLPCMMRWTMACVSKVVTAEYQSLICLFLATVRQGTGRGDSQNKKKKEWCEDQVLKVLGALKSL